MNRYKHFKGNYYIKIGEAVGQTPGFEGTQMVVYQSELTKDLFVRTKQDFEELVVKRDGQAVLRFEPVVEFDLSQLTLN